MIFVVFHFVRLDPTAKVVFYEYCQCFLALYIPMQEPLSILLLFPTRQRKSGCMHENVDVDIGDLSISEGDLNEQEIFLSTIYVQIYVYKINL